MRIRSALIAAAIAAPALLGACSTTDSANEGAVQTVDDTQWYCLDENGNIVDEDYCNPDESEFDPTYFLWLGPLGIYVPGDELDSKDKKKAKKSQKPAGSVSTSKPSTSKPSSAKPAPKPQGGSVKSAPAPKPAPKAPSAPKK